MTDAIQKAILSANNASVDVNDTITSAENAIGDGISIAEDTYNEALTTFNDAKDLLPTEADIELQKRKLEASALEKKAELDKLLSLSTEDAIEKLKELLNGLTLPTINFPPKLPVLDPKILQAVEIAKQVKELYKKRQQLSRENLLKGASTFEYPLSKVRIEDPRERLPALPREIPELPEIPDLPLK